MAHRKCRGSAPWPADKEVAESIQLDSVAYTWTYLGLWELVLAFPKWIQDSHMSLYGILYVCWLRQMSFVVYWKCATARKGHDETLMCHSELKTARWEEQGQAMRQRETFLQPEEMTKEECHEWACCLIHLPFGIKLSKTRSGNRFCPC